MNEARVLVVDDSAAMRALFCDVLEQSKNVKVVGTAGLWLVCLLLLYLRYSHTVSARRLAWLSIFAFALTVIVLAATHPFATPPGGES